MTTLKFNPLTKTKLDPSWHVVSPSGTVQGRYQALGGAKAAARNARRTSGIAWMVRNSETGEMIDPTT
jgi:hypothetical protein